MRRRSTPIILVCALALLFHQSGFPAAQTATDVEKKAAESWESFQGYGHTKKADAVASGKKLLSDMDTKIKQLEAKASKTSGDTKAAYEKEIKTLKAKRNETAKNLAAMEKSSASSWDSSKQDFANSYKDLHQSYNNAVNTLK
jgi:Skp family chaperone for outer membrane proteins